MMTSKSLFLIQDEHLFPVSYLSGHEQDLFLMVEGRERYSAYNFHKHRIIFHLSSMRHYARELRHADLNLVYFEMNEANGLSCEEILEKVLKESDLQKIVSFEIENKATEKWLSEFCQKKGIELEYKTTPQFLNTRSEFLRYLGQNSRPSIKSFYEDQRRGRNILMEANGEPSGGYFTFADEERLKWSQEGGGTPKFPISVRSEIDQKVIHLVDEEFAENPGEALTFWYPTSRECAHEALNDFCKYRLAEYGPYEETMCPHQDFLFHSVLSPLLNVGYLVPQEVLDTVLKHASENPVPLNSLESFVRRILGQREYCRGIYQNFGDLQSESNFWRHQRMPNKNWYQGRTGVPPLDDAIQKALRLGYNHHVERLKVICNMMNLAEIHPLQAHKWFMEMQIDSAEWAVGPNVFGLGLHSDGGIFAHNFHLCSSSYWLKISPYKKSEWCHEVDGLYWRFIDKHIDYFIKNPRLSVVASNLEKLSAERKELLWRSAEQFLSRNTTLSSKAGISHHQPQPQM